MPIEGKLLSTSFFENVEEMYTSRCNQKHNQPQRSTIHRFILIQLKPYAIHRSKCVSRRFNLANNRVAWRLVVKRIFQRAGLRVQK